MQHKEEIQHVFLIGAKSLGAYGGYETSRFDSCLDYPQSTEICGSSAR